MSLADSLHPRLCSITPSGWKTKTGGLTVPRSPDSTSRFEDDEVVEVDEAGVVEICIIAAFFEGLDESDVVVTVDKATAIEDGGACERYKRLFQNFVAER
ncbi:MAG: hypothetical protein IT435_12945 [Phycisphaerales bacterium]|nr:hypothetical protein [Phycisphaerales bacterium]